MKIELSKEHVQQLLQMVKTANFRGDSAEQVIKLIKALEGGINANENNNPRRRNNK